MLEQLAGELGGVYGLGTGPVRMAVVGDPVSLRELFAMPVDRFRWGHKFNVLGFVVGEGSMIVSDGPDHRRRRGAVQAAFSRRRLNRWIPTIVVRALFGERLAARAEEIGGLFRRPQDYLEGPAVTQLPHPLPWTARARVRQDRRALDTIIDAEIDRLRADPSDDPLDVLACLVADGTLDDGEIRDQVVTLMGAGYDTTAATLAWMLWCVSTTPGLWGRLRAEADDVLGPVGAGVPPDEGSLAALDLARRTMQETTRLHPAGVVSPREATVDVEPVSDVLPRPVGMVVNRPEGGAPMRVAIRRPVRL